MLYIFKILQEIKLVSILQKGLYLLLFLIPFHYVAFLDSDDEWLLEKLEKQIYFFQKEESVNIIYTKFQYLDIEENTKDSLFQDFEGNFYEQLLLSNIVGTTSTVIVKKKCFTKVGLFDEQLPACQDWDMWIRLAKFYSLKKIEKPLVKYNYHKIQISNDIDAICNGHLKIYKKYQSEINNRGKYFKAFYFFRLGNYLCHKRKVDLGRRYLFNAFIRCPFNVKYFIYFIISLFGSSTYICLARLKKFINKKL